MMRRRNTSALLVLAAVMLIIVPLARASTDSRSLDVTVDRPRISTQLGESFTFRSTIANPGAEPAEGYIAHLNVLSLKPGTYVDPEDWSSDRTQYLDPIPAGGSMTITWRMQAVNDGVFGVYVAVLPESGRADPPMTTPTLHLDVAERKKLNAGGLLPVALGIPALLGVVAVGVRFSRRG